MDSSREPSLWRSLAVAFGDGLAFGVGLTLTQKAGRRDALPRPETVTRSARLEELELRLAQLTHAPVRVNPTVLEAIVKALEDRLRERDAQWAERLAAATGAAAEAVRRETGAQVAAIHQESVERVNALRRDVLADLESLESQAAAFQHEIGDALDRTIEDRVTTLLERRMGDVEARLRDETRELAGQAGAAAEHAMEHAMEQKLARYEELLEQRGREIVELRQALASNERGTRDLLQALGGVLHSAAERMGPPAGNAAGDPGEKPAASAPAAEAHGTPPEMPPGNPPRFDVEHSPLWRLPLVSSLVVAGGCLACLHWL